MDSVYVMTRTFDIGVLSMLKAAGTRYGMPGIPVMLSRVSSEIQKGKYYNLTFDFLRSEL